VKCRGEHDIATNEQLGRLLTELVANNDLVVVDVSEAKFLDSTFLHNIVKADRLGRERGTFVRLQIGAEAIVMRSLEVSGILTRIDHAHSREDALATD
jgi:anti-anti-sigma factor